MLRNIKTKFRRSFLSKKTEILKISERGQGRSKILKSEGVKN